MAVSTVGSSVGGELGRRGFLTSGAALTGLGVVGCDALSTDPDSGSDDASGGADLKEAPMLAEQVDAGELPELTQRLPDDPLVVEPVDKMGAYGGDWNTAMLGISGDAWFVRKIGYDHLMRWDVGFTEPIPNLAESIDVGDDGREYTMRLRPGLKWSDGEPFTADDIMFAYDDVAANSELSPVVATWLTSHGDPASLEKIDEVTVVVRFAEPHGLFLTHLATPAGSALSDKPMHYLRQFHADYNPDVQALADEAGAASWVDLFENKMDQLVNTQLPVMCPWRVEVPPGDGPRVVAVRNPFYWKTDPDGRQLPYLDRVVFNVVENEEVMLTNAANGEYDFHMRNFNTLQNKPVLARAQQEGVLDFVDTIPDKLNEFVLMLNLTHKDPVKREIFQNKDFRIGLSHAINRKELIDTVFQQQGEPWQVAPLRGDPLFDEEMATQYTEYDLDLANEYLDRSFPDRNGEGFRLGPDGNPIAFAVSVAAGNIPTHVPAAELVRQYWEEVGVRIQVSPEDYGHWYDKIDANDQDAVVWEADPARYAATKIEPRWYLPVSGNLFMVAWCNWYDPSHDEAEPEEPPEHVKRQFELYDQFLVTIDEAETEQLLNQIVQIAKEEFYAIGTLIQPEGYAIVRSDFHNVPNEVYDSWQYPAPSPTNPEQYFTDQQN